MRGREEGGSKGGSGEEEEEEEEEEGAARGHHGAFPTEPPAMPLLPGRMGSMSVLSQYGQQPFCRNSTSHVSWWKNCPHEAHTAMATSGIIERKKRTGSSGEYLAKSTM